MTSSRTGLPLVSVVLPTYDRAEVLSRSIGSVLQQNYQNWELIVWDDGSTDNTKCVVEAFTDSRIQYYFAPNRGAAYARNQALRRACGELLAFLDSDDEWVENKLSSQVSFLLAHPEIDIVFSDFENIDVKYQSRERWFDHSRNALNHNKTKNLSDEYFEIEHGFPESTLISNYVGTPTVLLRRECLQDFSQPFDETLRNAEDYVLFWHLGLRGYRIAYSHNVLMRRYRLETNLSRPNVDYWKSHISALNICSDVTRQAGYQLAFPWLRKELQNAWLKLAFSFKEENYGVGKVATAYYKSLYFGVNKRSFLVLTKLLLGKSKIQLLQRFSRQIVAVLSIKQ